MSPEPESLSTPEAVAELAPGGVLRIGVNLGNPVIAQPDPAGGAPRGVGPGLGRELARRLGLPAAYATYDSAGKMADAVRAGAWDVAFLAADPARAADIEFTEPYALIEGTYLVREGSPARRVADLDRPGVRVAVGAKTAYDLFLTRALRAAELVREPTSREAIERFLADGLDAAAGVRQPLLAAARAVPGLRVLEEAFTVIRQAAGVPRGRSAAARLVRAFIEEAKAGGLVERLLRESGQGEVTLAPPSAG